MRTVSSTGKFASKIYFIKSGPDVVYGPYSRKPTTSMVKSSYGGKIVTFVLDENENYIQQK